jgi:hypothetical protein
MLGVAFERAEHQRAGKAPAEPHPLDAIKTDASISCAASVLSRP